MNQKVRNDPSDDAGDFVEVYLIDLQLLMGANER
jgi:hypothetical protein